MAPLALALLAPLGDPLPLVIWLVFWIAAAFGLSAIFRRRFPGLYSVEMIGPLVVRDGAGVTRA